MQNFRIQLSNLSQYIGLRNNLASSDANWLIISSKLNLLHNSLSMHKSANADNLNWVIDDWYFLLEQSFSSAIKNGNA